MRLFILYIILILIKSNILYSQNNVSNEFENWLKYYALTSENFDQEGNIINLNSAINKYDFESTKLFSPLFIYSPDSISFIDLDSYSLLLEKDSLNNLISTGSEVDINIQLIQISDSTCSTLLFCGTPCIVHTAIWLNSNTINLLGFQNNEQNKFIPTIWEIDIQNNIMKEYLYTKSFSALNNNYNKIVRLKNVTFK